MDETWPDLLVREFAWYINTLRGYIYSINIRHNYCRFTSNVIMSVKNWPFVQNGRTTASLDTFFCHSASFQDTTPCILVYMCQRATVAGDATGGERPTGTGRRGWRRTPLTSPTRKTMMRPATASSNHSVSYDMNPCQARLPALAVPLVIREAGLVFHRQNPPPGFDHFSDSISTEWLCLYAAVKRTSVLDLNGSGWSNVHFRFYKIQVRGCVCV